MASKKDTRGLGIAVTGDKAGEVDLQQSLSAQSLSSFQTLVTIIEDDYAAFGEMRNGDFSTASAIRAVFVDDDDIELLPGMIQQNFEFRFHRMRCQQEFYRNGHERSEANSPLFERFHGCNCLTPFRPPQGREAAAPFEDRSLREIELTQEINGRVSQPRKGGAAAVHRFTLPPRVQPAVLE
jgi:hypothetical protein